MASNRGIEALVEQWDPVLRRAFLAAIADIQDRVQVSLVADLLERGDIIGAIETVGLDPAAFRPLDAAIMQAFEAGGSDTADRIPALRQPSGHRLQVRFDVRNPRAETWLREHSSSLVTEIIADQRQAIRQHLTAGMEAGQNPRSVAVDLVGRINPATGRREGGVIGLTAAQEEWCRRYAAELASGDRAALTRALRDRRFDRSVQKALREGAPIPGDTIARMVAAYRGRALRYRAEVVARTEAMRALHRSQIEAFEQAIGLGQVDEAAVTKVWRSSSDARVRDSHRALHGKAVGFRAAFVSPSGARLQYPGDPDAPASETVQCFAPWSRIALVGLQKVISRHYTGSLVEVAAGGIVSLAVTPNHPILTNRGWVPASEIVEGDNLVYCGNFDGASPARAMNVDNAYASAEQLGDAASTLGDHVWTGLGGVNLHGEVPDHQVDVVAFPSELLDHFKAASDECFGEIALAGADVDAGSELYDRLIDAGNRALAGSSSGLVSSRGASFSDAWVGQCRSPPVAVGDGGRSETEIREASGYYGTADADLVGDAEDRISAVEQAPDIGVVDGPLGSRIGGDRERLSFSRRLGIYGSNPEVIQAIFDRSKGDAEPLGDRPDGEPVGQKGSDTIVEPAALSAKPLSGGGTCSIAFSPIKVTSVRHRLYSGPVFNFETSTNIIIAEGVIAHNCRCWMSVRIDHLAAAVAAERGGAAPVPPVASAVAPPPASASAGGDIPSAIESLLAELSQTKTPSTLKPLPPQTPPPQRGPDLGHVRSGTTKVMVAPRTTARWSPASAAEAEAEQLRQIKAAQLSPDERLAQSEYKGSLYGAWNAALRRAGGDDSKIPPEFVDRTKRLDAAIARHVLPTDLLLHRGARYDSQFPTIASAIAQKGFTYRNPAYSSTSTQRIVAEGFAWSADKPPAPMVVFTIRVKKGDRALAGTDYESEYIFPRGKEWRILDVEQVGPDMVHVLLEPL